MKIPKFKNLIFLFCIYLLIDLNCTKLDYEVDESVLNDNEGFLKKTENLDYLSGVYLKKYSFML